MSFPLLRGEVELFLCPANTSLLPYIFLFHSILLLLFLGNKGIRHFVSALIDPLVKDEISDLQIFSLMLKAANNNILNKEYPIGYSFSQLVFLSKTFVFI